MAWRIIRDMILFGVLVLLIVAMLIGAAWGLWVCFFAWQLSEWAPLVITACSVFWISVGGLLWLRSSVKRS